MAVSEVSICNLALQKLGAERITSLTQDHPNAREMNACYTDMRDLELRTYRWGFAKKRATLAAHATTPNTNSGFAYAYPVPSDFLRLLAQNESNLFEGDNTVDWKIENHEGVKCIMSSYATMHIVYIAQITDPALFDSAFVDMLASRIAMQTCERLTQSNKKREYAAQEYQMSRKMARQANAYESMPTRGLEDTWYSVRR